MPLLAEQVVARASVDLRGRPVRIDVLAVLQAEPDLHRRRRLCTARRVPERVAGRAVEMPVVVSVADLEIELAG